MFSLKHKYIHKNIFYSSFDARVDYTGERDEKPKVAEKIIDPNDIPGRKAELLKDFNAALTGRLSSLGIPFNTKAFGEKMEGLINTVLDSKKIPDIAKRKFLDDLKSKMELFTKISKDDIEKLRNHRSSTLSIVGMSDLEESQFMKKDRNGNLVRMDEMDIQIYYLRMILDANLAKYVEGSSFLLIEGFEKEATRINGVDYHKESLKSYVEMIQATDKKYGLNISLDAEKHRNVGTKEGIDLTNAGLFRDMRLSLIRELMRRDPEFAKKQAQLIKTLESNPSFQIQYHPSMVVKLDGKTYPLRDIVNDYAKVNGDWQAKEQTIRNAREVALSDDAIAKSKKWLGFDQIESDFSTLSQEKIEDQLRKSSSADIVIQILQAAQIAPALGDALGVKMDTGSALYGIDIDGKKLTGTERTIAGVMGPLGLIFVGGAINKVRKGPKAIMLFAALKKVLTPEKISEMSQKLGAKSKAFIEIIGKFMRWIGEGVNARISQSQTHFAFVQSDNRSMTGTQNLVSNSDAKAKAIKLNQKIAETAKAKGITPDEERIFQIVERFPDLKKVLEDKAIRDELIRIHNIGKDGESVGEYGFGSLRAKTEAARKVLMEKGGMEEKQVEDIVGKLIREGYLGNLPTEQKVRVSTFDRGDAINGIGSRMIHHEITIDIRSLRQGDWVMRKSGTGTYDLVQIESIGNDGKFAFRHGDGRFTASVDSIVSNRIDNPERFGLKSSTTTGRKMDVVSIDRLNEGLNAKKTELNKVTGEIENLLRDLDRRDDAYIWTQIGNGTRTYYRNYKVFGTEWKKVEELEGQRGILENEIKDLRKRLKVQPQLYAEARNTETTGVSYNAPSFEYYPGELKKLENERGMNIPTNASPQIVGFNHEELHFKGRDGDYSTRRTTPYRYGRAYEIDEEYSALMAMSKVSDHVAQPKKIVRDKNGQMTGYYSEKVRNIYNGDLKSIPKGLKKAIIDEFKKLHVNGLCHGDAVGNIIIYYPDPRNKEILDFKIIDPVGYKKNFEYFHEAVQQEIIDLENALNYRTLNITPEQVLASTIAASSLLGAGALLLSDDEEPKK